MPASVDKYIPVLTYRWLTPLYDTIMRYFMREMAFKSRLVEQARIEEGQRVLDLGCGTGTLTIMVKRLHPAAEVVGLDVDPQILEIARGKIARAGLEIRLDRGMAFELPYPDGSFDRVLSSMVFHHLTRENKVRMLKEAYRVMRPGGELHVADFGKPSNAPMRAVSLIMRGWEEVGDNYRGLLPVIFGNAGFEGIDETAHYTTLVGTIRLYRARKLR